MDLPLVTVGVASYNNALYLRETLESIRLQTYPRVELLIVDDASSDDSVTVAENWLAAYPEVNGRLTRHSTNLGVCRVCNDIVTQAKGEFICIIGSDDVYLPDKLAIQVSILQMASPQVGVVFNAVEAIGPKGESLNTPPEWNNISQGRIFLPLLQQNFVLAMGTLVRRNCYEIVGLYDENLAYEDADMWLRIAKVFEFKYSSIVTAKYRLHQSSTMHSRRAVFTESTLRILNKHWGLSPEGDKIIASHSSELAEVLYQLGSSQAKIWLKLRWHRKHDLRSWGLYMLASLGIPGSKVKRLQQFLGRLA